MFFSWGLFSMNSKIAVVGHYLGCHCGDSDLGKKGGLFHLKFPGSKKVRARIRAAAITECSLLACSSGICFLLPSRTTCPRAVSPGELDLSASVLSQENALQTPSWGTADVLTALLFGIQRPATGRFPSCGLSRGSVKSFQMIQNLKDGVVLSQRWPAHLGATCSFVV